MKKPRKPKKTHLKGLVQSGVIFIGDIGYMAEGNHTSAAPIEPDPLNPFKDLDRFTSQLKDDETNLELPGSFNGDLPGRGVIINTNMLNGSYTVKRKLDKETGKLLSLTIKFKD